MKDRAGNWRCNKCNKIIVEWAELLQSTPLGAYCDYCRPEEKRAARGTDTVGCLTYTTKADGLIGGTVRRG